MPRPSTLSAETVAKAVQSYSDKNGGRLPKLIELRAELGNTGSMSTISRLFADWKAGQLTEAEEIGVELPENLKNELNTLAAKFWAQAQANALEAVAAIQRERAEEQAEAREREQQLLEVINTLEDENHEQEEQLGRAQQQHELDESRLAAMAEQFHDMRAQAAVNHEKARGLQAQLDRANAMIERSLSGATQAQPAPEPKAPRARKAKAEPQAEAQDPAEAEAPQTVN